MDDRFDVLLGITFLSLSIFVSREILLSVLNSSPRSWELYNSIFYFKNHYQFLFFEEYITLDCLDKLVIDMRYEASVKGVGNRTCWESEDLCAPLRWLYDAPWVPLRQKQKFGNRLLLRWFNTIHYTIQWCNITCVPLINLIHKIRCPFLKMDSS